MKRRDFALLLGSAAVAMPFAAPAQQKAMPVIACLDNGEPRVSVMAEAFKRGLRETGYVDGQNVAIEYFWHESVKGRSPSQAAELVSRGVDLILLNINTPGALAMKAATSTLFGA